MESTEIKVFNEQEVLGKQFRIYGTPAEPLFLAKDVALWIEHSDVSTMMRTVDDDEKVTNNVCTLGGCQQAWFLTEDGLYEVLMQSRKPIAKQFKAKVKEILKDVRTHGAYLTPEKIEEVLSDPDTIISLATQLKAERQARLAAEQQSALLKPKGDYYDALVDRDHLVSFTVFAKEINVSRKAMIARLVERGYLYRDQRRNLQATAKYVNAGWFEVKDFVHGDATGVQVLITPHGKQQLIKLTADLVQKRKIG